MLGLKTQESAKFNVFWELVQREARKKNCIFFGEFGEGDDFETETMEGESFCGWLIPTEDAEEFEKIWITNDVPDDWAETMAWAEWLMKDEKVQIKFNFAN